ncbi:MAG: Asp-tRNA(Asn)/Glu-tRNA(Gln) amidotransferase subunit GatC [Planctomycetes bacterium]|nr:Asp-tRNA(Asn)/Glu-tRNA(Gln) amidotransferase subunit GatC [Planctomycetota bacterium]
MSLSADEVRQVADLARLEISDADLEPMARQLSAILDYINQLQKVNTDGVEPLAHALELHDVFREDVTGHSLSVEEALANAPARKNDFYRVPPVFGE